MVENSTISEKRKKATVSFHIGKNARGKSTQIRFFREKHPSLHIINLDPHKAGLRAIFTTGVSTLPLDVASAGQVANWLWARLEAHAPIGEPVMIDTNGTDPRLVEFAFNYPFGEISIDLGLEPTVVFYAGCDKDDVEFLEKFEKAKALVGCRTIIAFCEQALVPHITQEEALKSFLSNGTVRALQKRGGRLISLPSCTDLQSVADNAASFSAIADKHAILESPVSRWARHRIGTWTRQNAEAWRTVLPWLL